MKPLDTHPCPHCSAKSIGAWRKVNSSPFKPVICRACGNASYAAGPCSAISMITMQLLFLGSLFLAVLLGSVYWLLAFPMGLIAMTFTLGRIFPLVAAGASVREIRRKAVRRAWYVAGGGALVLALLSLLYSPPALSRTTLFTSLGAEHGVSLHDDPGQLNSRLIYFTYADFRRALRSARAPTSANP
jgi:hypothetical protein